VHKSPWLLCIGGRAVSASFSPRNPAAAAAAAVGLELLNTAAPQYSVQALRCGSMRSQRLVQHASANHSIIQSEVAQVVRTTAKSTKDGVQIESSPGKSQ